MNRKALSGLLVVAALQSIWLPGCADGPALDPRSRGADGELGRVALPVNNGDEDFDAPEENHVVNIQAEDGFGTGFHISPTHILTAAHVVAGEKIENLHVQYGRDTTPAGVKKTVGVIKMHVAPDFVGGGSQILSGHDVAILKVCG